MPIALVEGEERQVDVQLMPVVGTGELYIRRFHIWVRPEPGGECGQWSARCDVKNNGPGPATGTIHCTGELHQLGGFNIIPVDVLREFTLAEGETYEFILDWTEFLYLQSFDDCWLKIDTSWGEATRPLWFQPGYYELSGPTMTAFDVQSDSVAIRFARGGFETKNWSISIRTPPTYTAEQLIEDVLRDDESWTSWYYYGMGLLSKRDYKAYGDAGGKYAETYFTTK